MLKTRPYYSLGAASSKFYDLVTTTDKSLRDDVDFYAGLIPEGGSVLELGSGTGRVARALAERGFQVTGLEIAPAMLAQAEARRDLASAAVQKRLRYVRGDMTSFRLGRTLDTVICPFYALAHLPRGAAWRNTFQAIAEHLSPGGLSALHMPIAEKMALSPPPKDQPVFTHSLADQSQLTLYVLEHSYRANIDRMDLTLDYVISGPNGSKHNRERLTYYAGDPTDFADAFGLVVDRPAVPLGELGVIHIYRRVEPSLT